MQSGKDKKKQANLEKKETELQQKVAGKAMQTELKEFTYDHETVDGEKKNIEGKWPDAYNPKVIEKHWYSWWNKNGFFNPDKQQNKAADAPVFTVLIPPPNVTGSLHIGHALTNAVQDALVRYYRQSGYKTEWLSGTDHAGISCQVVVEKQLAKQNLTRHDLGREKFIEKVWEWKKDYGNKICNQLRRLGSSLDWDREVFTLDKQRTIAHDEAFIRLFNDGLVYRDNRLVGWDCTLQTAISDVEVEYMEVKTPIQLQVGSQKYPFGYLWNFSYPVVEGPLLEKSNEELAQIFANDRSQFANTLTFGTTRPETMIGDSAVAVHPDDERYKQFHNKFVFHPIRQIKIPIICDAVLVDMAFGTGVVKITPAHDPNDFEVGKRHNLEFCNMLQENGRCYCPFSQQLHNMPRLDARIEIIRIMQQYGLYKDKTPNPMAIGLSQRSHDVVEPMMRPQWYINCQQMAKRALDAVEQGELIITPKIHEQTWRNYLENIRPWCVSRQLWWGHQIPLYKVWLKQQEEPNGGDVKDWVAGRNDQEAIENAVAKLKANVDDIMIKRDIDVTDTWFSSGLFPFSAFGWPETTDDLSQFFPSAVLETGYDILFFWVARMVMLSLQLQDKLPFREVYLHAMVRDSKGEKMSKSKGNVIDPLDCIDGASLQQLNDSIRQSNLGEKEIVEACKLQKAEFPAGIAQCGTDALRLALCVYAAQQRNINLDVNKIVAQRNFCNKIFNCVKFGISFCGIDQQFVDATKYSSAEAFLQHVNGKLEQMTLANRFIIAKLLHFIHQYHKAMRTYNVAVAAESCVQFWWDSLCDVYVELVKPILIDKKGSQDLIEQTRLTLLSCIDLGLRLISVFMPFVCEEMFQRIPRWAGEHKLETIMFAALPRDCKYFNFGNGQEYDNYDELLIDTNSTYAQLHIQPLINSAVAEIEMMKPLINSARSMRAQYNIQSQKLKFYIQTSQQLNEEQLAMFSVLANAESVQVIAQGETPRFCASNVVDEKFAVFVELKGLINVQQELKKLDTEVQNITQQREKLVALMNSDNYGRLPQQLRQQNDVKLVGLEDKLKNCELLKKSYAELE